MFGYIKPLASELKVREFELYKSFYCGLCKTMGEKISRLSRMTLSYDMVFLAMIRIALTKETPENISNISFRCKLKPTKKRNYIKTNEALIYSSCVAAILSYYKCEDDINDADSKLKKLFLKPLLLFFSRIKKRACAYYPGLDGQIKPQIFKLSELEKNKCKSIDETASCFAELMKNVLSFGLTTSESESEPGSAQIRIAEAIGLHLGRWLYIIDALDDFRKDLKKNEYNPFIERYGDANSVASDIDTIKSSLTSGLSEISLAFSLAGNKDADGNNSCVNPIILNIINLGLCECQEKIFKKLIREVF